MQDLEKFKNEMNLSGKNVYVGHRYVPKIFGEWDKTKIYEPLSIVQYQGNSFTSRQYTPSGVEITNEEYWASTGNYNAQVEQYRQDVRNLENDVNNINDEVITARNGETSLSERLDNQHQEVTTRLSQIVVDISQFGVFGSDNDNINFLKAVNFTKENNLTLQVRNQVINLHDLTLDDFPNMLMINSKINLFGVNRFNRKTNGFHLKGVNILAHDYQSEPLFTVDNVENINIENFKFVYKVSTKDRFNNVFNFSHVENLKMDMVFIEGVDGGVTIKDRDGIATSKDIVIHNTTFKNTKTGFYISAIRQQGSIGNIDFKNTKMINTLEQSRMYTKLEGASLYMFENGVENFTIDNTYVEFPVERIGYFNGVSNGVIKNTTGKNTSGIKIAGYVENISRNILIDGMNLVNEFRGGYLFRGYFCEDVIVDNVKIDNSKMVVKPTDAFSTSAWVKNLKISNFYVDGVQHVYTNRYDDMLGISAFVDFIPILEKLHFSKGLVKNIYTGNTGSMFNFINYMEPDNPNKDMIDEYIVFTDFKLDDIVFKLDKDFYGYLGNFKNVGEKLTINVTLDGYDGTRNDSVYLLSDNITTEVLKDIDIVVKSSNFGSSSYHVLNYVGLNNGSTITFITETGDILRIVGNDEGVITGYVEKPMRQIETGSSIFTPNMSGRNEKIIVHYDDGVDRGIIELSYGVAKVVNGTENFEEGNVIKNLNVYSTGDYPRIQNNTGKTRYPVLRLIIR